MILFYTTDLVSLPGHCHFLFGEPISPLAFPGGSQGFLVASWRPLTKLGRMRHPYSNWAEDRYSEPFGHLNTHLDEEYGDGARSCTVSHTGICVEFRLIWYVTFLKCTVSLAPGCYFIRILCTAHFLLGTTSQLVFPAPVSILWSSISISLAVGFQKVDFFFWCGLGFLSPHTLMYPKGFRYNTFNFEFQTLYLPVLQGWSLDLLRISSTPSRLFFWYLPHLWMVLPSPYFQSWNVIYMYWEPALVSLLLSLFPLVLESSFQNDLVFVSSVSTWVSLSPALSRGLLTGVWLPLLHQRALWCCCPLPLLAWQCAFHWVPSGVFLHLNWLLSPSSLSSCGVTLTGYHEMSDMRIHSFSFVFF